MSYFEDDPEPDGDPDDPLGVGLGREVLERIAQLASAGPPSKPIPLQRVLAVDLHVGDIIVTDSLRTIASMGQWKTDDHLGTTTSTRQLYFLTPNGHERAGFKTQPLDRFDIISRGTPVPKSLWGLFA